MTREWYGWLLAIRRTNRWDGAMAWQDAFRAAGKRLFFAISDELLDPDGYMYMGPRSPHGRHQFVDTAEVAAVFGAAPWFDLAAPCPWVGEVAGFLSWEWWTDDTETRRFDVERLLGASKGYAVRLRDGMCWDVMAENTYQLIEASQKHGFGDGDDLPELGDGYEHYVWSQIAAALGKLGLRAERIRYGTSHNRIRFDQLIPAPGQTHAQCWETLRRHERDPLVLWAYNNDRERLAELIRD